MNNHIVNDLSLTVNTDEKFHECTITDDLEQTHHRKQQLPSDLCLSFT